MTSRKIDAVTTTVDLPALRRAVRFLCLVVERRNTVPILSNIALRYAGGALTLVGTDLDAYMVIEIPAEGGDRVWETTADARALEAMLASMTGETVELSVVDGEKGKERSERRLVVSADGAEARLRDMPYDDMPKVPETTWTEGASLNPKRLASDLAFVAPAISSEETRYYLNGICLAEYDGQQCLVATDGHRLHLAACEQDRRLPSAKRPIIPRRFIAVLRRLLAAHPGANDITVSFNDGGSKLKVEISNIVLVTKLIDGTFPDFTRVIPKPEANETLLTIGSASELAAAVRRAAAIAYGEKTRAVSVTWSSGSITLACKSPENGEMKAAVRGGDGGLYSAFTVGFNHRYLDTIAAGFAKAKLEIRLADPAAPSLITSPDAAGRLCVLMPMRV